MHRIINETEVQNLKKTYPRTRSELAPLQISCSKPSDLCTNLLQAQICKFNNIDFIEIYSVQGSCFERLQI